MKISKSTKYSALFFLIFIFGVIFFVTAINKSLNKRTQVFPVDTQKSTEQVALTIRE